MNKTQPQVNYSIQNSIYGHPIFTQNNYCKICYFSLIQKQLYVYTYNYEKINQNLVSDSQTLI